MIINSSLQASPPQLVQLAQFLRPSASGTGSNSWHPLNPVVILDQPFFNGIKVRLSGLELPEGHGSLTKPPKKFGGFVRRKIPCFLGSVGVLCVSIQAYRFHFLATFPASAIALNNPLPVGTASDPCFRKILTSYDTAIMSSVPPMTTSSASFLQPNPV